MSKTKSEEAAIIADALGAFARAWQDAVAGKVLPLKESTHYLAGFARGSTARTEAVAEYRETIENGIRLSRGPDISPKRALEIKRLIQAGERIDGGSK